MSGKNLTYEEAKKYVKDKDTAIRTFIESSLDKTQQIFTYENLPDTIPQSELEKLLQVNGHCIITKHNDNLFAFSGGFSGENDVYENPRFYTVSNTALNLYKTFEIGVDCVLMKNDFNMVSILPVLKKYGVLLTDSEISLNTATILSRITMLISAPDDKTKASADLFIKKILDGDFTIIGENGFFDGVHLQTSATTNSNYITQLIELIQYYKASFLNEIGLNANYNMKRERLSQNEILLNVDNLLPFIENMFSERQKSVALINEMFGCEIVVDYNGVWKATHEHADKEERTVNTITEEESEMSGEIETKKEISEETIDVPIEEESETSDEPTDEPIDETSDEPTEEPTDEPTDELADETEVEEMSDNNEEIESDPEEMSDNDEEEISDEEDEEEVKENAKSE